MTSNLQLRSTINDNNTLELALHQGKMPEPGPDEVLIRIEATPINPSDLGVLFGPADMTTARQEGSAESPVIIADVPKQMMPSVAARVGKAIPVGNEGAGTVVAAGSSDGAQALMGKTVAYFGGGAYQQYIKANIMQCMALPDGVTAADGASATVNPMTALAMAETMRSEGHKAIVHTAAASNLGQMLNRICRADGIDLVNVVRKESQEKLLRNMGAKYVVNSSSDSFFKDLSAALKATGATIVFDAIGGGRLASDIMSCMEAIERGKMDEHSVYGSNTYKQLYIYGFLQRDTTTINAPALGFAWGAGAFLLTHFVQKAGLEKIMEMRGRIAAEIKTTFASHYTDEINLRQALTLETLQQYGQQATGQKYLLNPNG